MVKIYQDNKVTIHFNPRTNRAVLSNSKGSRIVSTRVSNTMLRSGNRNAIKHLKTLLIRRAYLLGQLPTDLMSLSV